MSQFLINTPAANDFMGLAATDTGCRAFLGDADACNAHVGPDITLAQITLRDSALKVAALVQDPIHSYVDDLAFFSSLLCADLSAHGERVRKAATKLFGKVQPRVSKPDFTTPKAIALMPSSSNYDQWLGAFEELPNTA